jgi:hypothetical protein
LADWSISVEVDRRDRIDLWEVPPPESATETWPTSTAEAAEAAATTSSHLSENQVEPWSDLTGCGNPSRRFPTSRRRSLRRPVKVKRRSSRPCSEGPSP